MGKGGENTKKVPIFKPGRKDRSKGRGYRASGGGQERGRGPNVRTAEYITLGPAHKKMLKTFGLKRPVKRVGRNRHAGEKNE